MLTDEIEETRNESGAPDQPFGLSRAAMVGLDRAGAFVSSRSERQLRLDLGGLLLVRALASPQGRAPREAVARAAARSGQSEQELLELLDRLHTGSFLTTSARPTPPPPPAQPSVLGTIDTSHELVLPTPIFLRVTERGFEWFDHDATQGLTLDARQALALSTYAAVRTFADAFDAHAEVLGAAQLSRESFEAVTQRAIAVGLLAPFDPNDPAQSNAAQEAARMREELRRQLEVKQTFDAMSAEFEVTEQRRTANTGRTRVPVVGVNTRWNLPPASLGILISYAKAYEGGVLEQDYAFHPSLLIDAPGLAALAARPSVFLFSNYIWCHHENQQLSEMVKRINPHNLAIHGGPDTPKYAGDVEVYFAEHPNVDITVRGEGELTLAHLLDVLRGHLGDGPPDLSVLADVPGLSYRAPDGSVVHTADRERQTELDEIPSPVLTGLFDGFRAAASSSFVILETNRGCPYGCTFCDWGSATLSRIRKFDLDRVFAELEWCASNGMSYVVLADANFGIFERDVEIAQRIADLRAEYGTPATVGTNYAKNTVKHLSKIIDIFASAGIVAEGKVSLQTMDQETLTVIKRKNIKVEKYNDLSVEFRKNDLPLSVELMMGLPGSTPEAFRQDLQECIARDVRTMVYPTILLPNSPMNDPAYREEHGIVARAGERVMQSATFSFEEWQQMERLTQVFLLCDLFGVLRQVSMFVHQETGIREVDFLERLLDAAEAERERFPTVVFTFEVVPMFMVPPVSWRLFLDEVKTYLVDDLGMADDSALATALDVQRAILPARERSFPLELELDHDFAAWHRAVLDARGADHRHDWTSVVPRLGSYGPATLPVDDPHGVCSGAMSEVLASLNLQGGFWEFGCEVSRPVVTEVA